MSVCQQNKIWSILYLWRNFMLWSLWILTLPLISNDNLYEITKITWKSHKSQCDVIYITVMWFQEHCTWVWQRGKSEKNPNSDTENRTQCPLLSPLREVQPKITGRHEASNLKLFLIKSSHKLGYILIYPIRTKYRSILY